MTTRRTFMQSLLALFALPSLIHIRNGSKIKGIGFTEYKMKSVSVRCVSLTRGGSGYSGTPTIVISGGGGTGANATFTIS